MRLIHRDCYGVSDLWKPVKFPVGESVRCRIAEDLRGAFLKLATRAVPSRATDLNEPVRVGSNGEIVLSGVGEGVSAGGSNAPAVLRSEIAYTSATLHVLIYGYQVLSAD
jgi:hypothetical protein